MKYFKKLLGDRIYLSPRNSEDMELFTMWLNDFNVTDFTGRSAQMVTLDNEKEYLEKEESDSRPFSIVELETDKLIGCVGLDKIDFIHRTATLGIFIGDEEFLSKGYGAEAIRLVLDYGFNYLNLNVIDLGVLEANPRAIKCYKKVGFKEIGRKRKWRFINGKYYDVITMDILKEEFTDTFIRNKNL